MKHYTEHSKHLRGKDVADREEKKVARERGIVLQPRYRDSIGPTPVLVAGDCAGAGRYLERVTRALHSGGWTRDERNRLKRIKRKWIEKAEGRDAWFMSNGNPQSGEDGNAYGREGWREERRRDRIKSAVNEINQEFGHGKTEAKTIEGDGIRSAGGGQPGA